MKYTFIILFTILSVSAFSQPYIPSAEHIDFEGNGFAFNTHTTTYLHIPPDPDKQIYSQEVITIANYFDADTLSGSNEGDIVTFDSKRFLYNVGGFDHNISQESRIELVVDSVQRVFSFLKYSFSQGQQWDPYGYSKDDLSYWVTFKNVPYQMNGDTLFFALDSSSLRQLITSSIYSASSYTSSPHAAKESHTYSSELLLGSNASLNGHFIKLKTNASGIDPKIYSTIIFPDTAKRRYEKDTISITYRNDWPDTVTITALNFYDDYRKNLTISYSDGSSLSTGRTILPYDKNYQLRLKLVSNEGPHELSRSAVFIATKSIRGVVSQDTFQIGLQMINVGIDYESQISTNLPNNVLEMDCEPGDTVFGTIHIYYSNGISNIHFDPIPDSTGFQLMDVQHLPNEKAVEFRYISSQEGLFQYWYPIEYVVQNFDGSVQQYTSSASIVLTSYVSPHSGVNQIQEKSLFSIFPNPTNGNISLALKNPSNGPIDISLCDMLGNTVQKERIQPADGAVSFKLHEGIADGVYFIVARGNNVFSKERLIVLRLLVH